MRRVHVRVDVSGHQDNVAWQTLWNSGVKWAHAKATEGTYYENPCFPQQYNGSYNVGMIRGAYHFATPNTASGAAQANYFVDNGGGRVPRRPDPAGRARHRVEPVRRPVPRPQPGRNGELDPGLHDGRRGAGRLGPVAWIRPDPASLA